MTVPGMTGRGSDLQPHNDQIPKSDHSDFSGRVVCPRFSVFDGDHVHIVEDEFHRDQAEKESQKITQDSTKGNGEWTMHLSSRLDD